MNVSTRVAELALFAINKVIEQGRPSQQGKCCAYRGSNGARCVIGWMIPDEKYVLEMEGSAVTRSMIRTAIEVQRGSADMEFLLLLQNAHDKAAKGPLGHFVMNFKAGVRNCLVGQSLYQLQECHAAMIMEVVNDVQ